MAGVSQSAARGHGAAVVNDDVRVAGRRLLQVHGRIMDPGDAGIDEQSPDVPAHAHQVQGLRDDPHIAPLAQLRQSAGHLVTGMQDANQGGAMWDLGAGKALCLAELVERAGPLGLLAALRHAGKVGRRGVAHRADLAAADRACGSRALRRRLDPALDACAAGWNGMRWVWH